MTYQAFKNYTDQEIAEIILSAIRGIRESVNQYGEIIITISGGRVKHIDVRKPLTLQEREKDNE